MLPRGHALSLTVIVWAILGCSGSVPLASFQPTTPTGPAPSIAAERRDRPVGGGPLVVGDRNDPANADAVTTIVGGPSGSAPSPTPASDTAIEPDDGHRRHRRHHRR